MLIIAYLGLQHVKPCISFPAPHQSWMVHALPPALKQGSPALRVSSVQLPSMQLRNNKEKMLQRANFCW